MESVDRPTISSLAGQTGEELPKMKLDLERHEYLKFRVRQNKSSYAQIARELGIAAGTVTAVSQGYKRSKRVEQAIATCLQTTAQEIFPERYPEEENK